jgi:hypothetical protein
MSSQDPIGSTVPPERPTNPTHFGGEGLYEPGADSPDSLDTMHTIAGADASSKEPLSEHLDSETNETLEGVKDSQRPVWEFARRNHVPTLLAIGGIAWLLVVLVRRSTERW